MKYYVIIIGSPDPEASTLFNKPPRNIKSTILTKTEYRERSVHWRNREKINYIALNIWIERGLLFWF